MLHTQEYRHTRVVLLQCTHCLLSPRLPMHPTLEHGFPPFSMLGALLANGDIRGSLHRKCIAMANRLNHIGSTPSSIPSSGTGSSHRSGLNLSTHMHLLCMHHTCSQSWAHSIIL